jgi:hypothetical protein
MHPNLLLFPSAIHRRVVFFILVIAVSFAFLAETAKKAAPPRVLVNGQRFETVQGEPFFPIADTAWLLVRLADDDIAHYIQTRSQQGFNVIKFGPESEKADFSKLGFILDTLAAHGMYAEIYVPTYDYQSDQLIQNHAEHAGNLAESLRHRSHIFAYSIEGLDSPHARRDPRDTQRRVMDARDAIKSADPERLVTFHPRSGQSVVDHAGIAPEYMDFYSVHKCNPGSIHSLIQAETERTPQKPVFLSEPVYEGRAGMCGCNQGCTADQALGQITEAIKAGAAGISYGHHSVWSFNLGADGAWGIDPSPAGLPWREALHAPGAMEIIVLAEELCLRTPAVSGDE